MKNDWLEILVGDNRQRLAELPEKSFQTCVTSPPYFGLRSYLPEGHESKGDEIGSEPTPDEFVATMVEVFRGVHRVLRDDGILWVNLGDSFNAYNHNRGPAAGANKNHHGVMPAAVRGLTCKELKPKDLIGIPWRVAFALQDDGWYLRSDVIWSKSNGMPESVSSRPTNSHEYVFMLTKSDRCFYDVESTKQPAKPTSVARYGRGRADGHKCEDGEQTIARSLDHMEDGSRLRSVWHGPTGQLKDNHFAVMPTWLAELCISASTSERGCCPSCGAPWERVVEKDRQPTRPGTNTKVPGGEYKADRYELEVGNRDPQRHTTTTKTTGWQPTCNCDVMQEELIKCRVLDPFGGAGTTALAAKHLARHCTLIELFDEYAKMAWKRATDPTPAKDVKRLKSMEGQASFW